MAGGIVALDNNTFEPSIPAQFTKRANAGKSAKSNSSGSSKTKSPLKSRNMGAICLPPRKLSVAGMRWSMVLTRMGA